MTIQTVILAAGQGKRMHSSLPKILHRLAGKPLIEYVLDAAHAVSSLPPIIVYGHQGDVIRSALASKKARWVKQSEQLGTGHAVLQTLPELNDADAVLVLSGDVPLISVNTLDKLISSTPKNALGMLTANLANPAGYGRIKRDKKKKITHIIEEKDATVKERAITEINTGIYLVPVKRLRKWLPALKNKNAQKEYYLTDIIAQAVKDKVAIHSVQPEQVEEIYGINDKLQLAQLERFHQRQLAETLMRQGVTLLDPARLDIRGDVQVGRDVVIDVNVILEGRVRIGNNCSIGPHAILRDVELGDSVEVKANSIIENAVISAACVIGPFARIRPGTVLAREVHIGNFVEIKNSEIGSSTKINHLSYIGDADIGQQVNIGAGTITCNYDGANKHRTVIGDHVHIGSDTQLIAPVTVGKAATIGAGSTVAKNVPAGELTLTHTLHQRSTKNWQRPKKPVKLEKT